MRDETTPQPPLHFFAERQEFVGDPSTSLYDQYVREDVIQLPCFPPAPIITTNLSFSQHTTRPPPNSPRTVAGLPPRRLNGAILVQHDIHHFEEFRKLRPSSVCSSPGFPASAATIYFMSGCLKSSDVNCIPFRGVWLYSLPCRCFHRAHSIEAAQATQERFEYKTADDTRRACG